jgi:hypothetical protein
VQVGDNRPGQRILARSITDVVGAEADGELAVVHTDDVKSVGVVLAVPALQDTEIANAVDAGVLPEIDEQDLAAIAFDGVGNIFAGGSGVNPLRVGGEIRGFLQFLILRMHGGCKKNRSDQNGEELSHGP